MTEPGRVVVVGAGAAGLSAALAAARTGAPTTLIESAGFVGGNSAVLPWLGFHSRKYQQVVSGIAAEVVERVRAAAPDGASQVELDPVCGSSVSMNSHVYRCVAMDMLRQAGVRVMLHSQLVGVERTGDRVTAVVLAGKSGRDVVPGEIFVDASGDGDLSVFAGAEWEKGRTADGRVQAPSLVFRVCGIDRAAFVSALQRSDTAFRDLLLDHPDALAKLRARLPDKQVIILGGFADAFERAKRDGAVDVPASRVVGVKTHIPDEFVAVTTKVADFDPTDAETLSGAYAEAYRQILPLMGFLTGYLPGFGKARLAEIAPMLGVRESRRVVGDYVLSTDDVIEGREFSDGIGMGAYHIDIHRPDGSWVDSHSVRPYDLPLRSLFVRGLENLLVAGKCFSASHEAVASTRVIPICMAQGQAAGTAAALALADGSQPRDVKAALVRERLRADGALLRDGLLPEDPALLDRIGSM